MDLRQRLAEKAREKEQQAAQAHAPSNAPRGRVRRDVDQRSRPVPGADPATTLNSFDIEIAGGTHTMVLGRVWTPDEVREAKALVERGFDYFREMSELAMTTNEEGESSINLFRFIATLPLDEIERRGHTLSKMAGALAMQIALLRAIYQTKQLPEAAAALTDPALYEEMQRKASAVRAAARAVGEGLDTSE